MFSEGFNPELSRILDRVYGVHLVDGIGREASAITTDLSRLRRREGAEALERALDGLRQVRERSQGVTALKDELAYLHNQITELQALGEEITRLRLQLGEPQIGRAAGEGATTPQG
jgi:hypothetical protein